MEEYINGDIYRRTNCQGMNIFIGALIAMEEYINGDIYRRTNCQGGRNTLFASARILLKRYDLRKF